MKDEFRTIVKIDAYAPLIDVHSRVMLMGSCFAENIGDAFRRGRLPVMVNPTGVIYNPFSIARSLEMLMNGKTIKDEELILHNEMWHHFHFHGRFSEVNRDEALLKMNNSLKQGHTYLKTASYLILTFGTAWVYERSDNGIIVANCHKFPGNFFVRRMLTPGQIVTRYKELIGKLNDFNPNLNIVFTVSPVRHLKDGAHGNQVSKSVLFLAIEELCSRFTNAVYFPAYEIVMDELRDYRFYDESMLHPSRQAIKYVWSRFAKFFLSLTARDYMIESEKVSRAREHRLMGKPTAAYQQFLNNTLALIDNIEAGFSVSHLHDDRLHFKSLIKRLYD